MATIVFETHSTTEDSDAGRATGWLPGKLSPTGRRQAKALGDRRDDDGVEAVFHSDLARAAETAAIAFKGSGIPTFADWRLRECNYGATNGDLSDHVQADRSKHLRVAYPDGESWAQAIQRVGWFVADIKRSQWSRSRIVVIGHMATWYGMEHHFRNRSLEHLTATDFEWQEGWEYHL